MGLMFIREVYFRPMKDMVSEGKSGNGTLVQGTQECYPTSKY